MNEIGDLSPSRAAVFTVARRAMLLMALLCSAVALSAFADESSASLDASVVPGDQTDTGQMTPVPSSLRGLMLLAQADDEPVEEDFIACAVICQRRLDKQLLNCSGYKNRGEEGRRAPAPAASCRDDAYGEYKSCRSTCNERWPGNRDKYPS